MTKTNWNRTDLIDESEQIARLNPRESGIVVEESEIGRVKIKKVVVEAGASKQMKKN